MCPSPDGGRNADDGSPLSPEELDIEDDEYVISLDADRYVIGTDERPEVPSDVEVPSDSTADAGRADVDPGRAKRLLEDDLDSVGARYGVHVTAKSEDAISHRQMFSDDVGTVFDDLLRWYAEQLTTETAVEDVLGILLTESNVRIRYSPSCLRTILESYDLGPEDTIADLLEAVRDDQGLVFPPENV